MGCAKKDPPIPGLPSFALWPFGALLPNNDSGWSCAWCAGTASVRPRKKRNVAPTALDAHDEPGAEPAATVTALSSPAAAHPKPLTDMSGGRRHILATGKDGTVWYHSYTDVQGREQQQAEKYPRSGHSLKNEIAMLRRLDSPNGEKNPHEGRKHLVSICANLENGGYAVRTTYMNYCTTRQEHCTAPTHTPGFWRHADGVSALNPAQSLWGSSRPWLQKTSDQGPSAVGYAGGPGAGMPAWQEHVSRVRIQQTITHCGPRLRHHLHR
jgi:hypothetical protein